MLASENSADADRNLTRQRHRPMLPTSVAIRLATDRGPIRGYARSDSDRLLIGLRSAMSRTSSAVKSQRRPVAHAESCSINSLIYIYFDQNYLKVNKNYFNMIKTASILFKIAIKIIQILIKIILHR